MSYPVQDNSQPIDYDPYDPASPFYDPALVAKQEELKKGHKKENVDTNSSMDSSAPVSDVESATSDSTDPSKAVGVHRQRRKIKDAYNVSSGVTAAGGKGEA